MCEAPAILPMWCLTKTETIRPPLAGPYPEMRPFPFRGPLQCDIQTLDKLPHEGKLS